MRIEETDVQDRRQRRALIEALDDHYGLSPLEAAAIAVDTHGAAAAWSKALLGNAARPFGRACLRWRQRHGPHGRAARPAQAEFTEQYQGAANSGRPLILEGGLDWKAMSLTPLDMDFLEAKHAATREIALAFGVPPVLLAIPGDNTYSNYQEANRVFWRQSVLPLAGRIGCALTHWLAPVFGGGLMLAIDTDKIEALSPDRVALWDRVSKAPFLSVNEKRLAVGYGPVEGGDVFTPAS